MKILFLLLISFSLNAAELNIGLYTTHIGVDGLNESNQLIGVSTEKYELGTFHNSYNVRSFYAAKRFEYNDKIGFMAGAVSGYNVDCVMGRGFCNESDLLPMFSVYIHITDNLTLIEMANAFMLVLRIPLETK